MKKQTLIPFAAKWLKYMSIQVFVLVCSFGIVAPSSVGALNDLGPAKDVYGLTAVLHSVPALLAKSIPYFLVLLLLILAGVHVYRALREYRVIRSLHARIAQIVKTKASVDSFLAITTHYISTPVAVMGGAVELLGSLKKVPATKLDSLKTKLNRLADAMSGLLSANQVSSAQSASGAAVRHPQRNAFTAAAVRVPALSAFTVLVAINALFIYAGVFNRSPYRIMIELSLYLLAVLLLALAYRYRLFMIATEEVANQRLEIESRLYRKRQTFIPQAIKVVTEHHEGLEAAAEPLKEIAEAKLFLNGLHMLGGIKDNLNNIKKFADFDAQIPLFDVTSHLQKAVHDYSARAAERGITFDAKIATGLVGYVQPEAVRQLVSSLIDNAIKFSKDGGRIQVSAYNRFGKLVFSVRDEGIGIAEEKLPSILRPFSRGADSTEFNYEGLGLGLYANKVIADRMGGTLTISSKLGEGTIVTISVPFHHEVDALTPVLVAPTPATD